MKVVTNTGSIMSSGSRYAVDDLLIVSEIEGGAYISLSRYCIVATNLFKVTPNTLSLPLDKLAKA